MLHEQTAQEAKHILKPENGKPIRRRATINDEVRSFIVQCARKGDDLKLVSQHLGVNIKTCRGIAKRDRETGLKRGFKKRKFSDEMVAKLRNIVSENPRITLTQIKAIFESENGGMTISETSIDRLLDCHGYSINEVPIQPIERNKIDIKISRACYAEWLLAYGRSVLRFYINETNFSVWCSRSTGRSPKDKPCIRYSHSKKRGMPEYHCLHFHPWSTTL